jgi:GT2 family glycosyltransferase
MTKIGLVTVLFNSDSLLDGFFKSLSVQTFKDYHLYLIDNTSNDVTDELIIKLTNKYKLTNYTHLKNPDNAGVAKGNNQGIELSLRECTTHTLLLNNDIEFDQPYLLENILAEAKKSGEAMLIPKIYFYDTRKIWMAGGAFLPRGTAIHVGEGDDDGPKYNNEGYFNYAPTCFILINNLVFEKIGLMDEKYFVYYDDTDFMYRAFKKGYKIKLLPQLHVYHKVSSITGGAESLFSIYYGNRNRIYYIGKNFKGIYYGYAMAFTLITRIVKYLRYNKNQKERLMDGMRAGFDLVKGS